MVSRIAIVAGETSGDMLGAQLIYSLKQYFPHAEFVGVAGPQMLAAGAKTLFPLEKLSVMGFSEVIARLPQLLNLRRQVKQFMQNFRPDVYIGIDAPDFNLPIEYFLRKKGIKTVHYNSPTIWAWRPKRILKIKQAVDLMLTLFPFEPPYYEAENIPAVYIGHPLAERIPLFPDVADAKEQLKLPPDKKIIALLPGSRAGEIKYIGPALLKAAWEYYQQYPETLFISPLVNEKRLAQFKQQHQDYAPHLPLNFYLNHSHTVMAAADIIALASGTATLEAMLFKKPMVVVYRGSGLSYYIAKMLVKIKHFSLPNILSSKALVPELIQHQATPQNIAQALINWDYVPQRLIEVQQCFLKIHRQLRCNASEKAALAIKNLLSPSCN